MPRGNGGIIGPVNTSFSGVWSLTEAQLRRSANTWPNFYAALLSESATGSDVFSGADAADPYFEYTTLLLPGNGTNGAQNNTFLDSSTNNFTITRNGNTTQGTFSPFSQTGWGNYFNGSSYLSAGTTLFNYTTGNASTTTFTIEAFVYLTSYQTPSQIYYSPCIISKGDIYLNLGVNGSGNLIFYHYDGTARSITGSTVIPLNTWTYVAVTVTGGTATIYVNGSSVGSGTWYGIQSAGQNTTSLIGRASTNASSLYFNGYMSNLRVSTVARTITTPTVAYVNDANTALLTAQSNRFVDNSSSPITLTLTGSPSVQAFSPFNPTASWSAATYGGSGYFDGSGDSLSVANNTALQLTGEFTMEAWYYPLGFPGGGLYDCLLTTGDNSLSNAIAIYINSSGGIQLYNHVTNAAIFNTASGVVLNAWNHIAATRNSSNGVDLWLNGVSQGSTVTVSSSFTSTTPTRIGTSSTNQDCYGYISTTRIVKGAAVYTGAFTPPIAPLSTSGSASASAYPSTTNVNTSFASSATSLLLNFTNAGIYDATSKNDLETVGNAQISTAQYKFPPSSMAFDGTGDWLLQPTSPLLSFGSGNFTIESWVRIAAHTNADAAICLNWTGTWAANYWALHPDHSSANEKFSFWAYNYSTSTPVLTSSTTVATGTWYHIAVTRSGSTWRMFVNGTLEATQTSSAALDAGTTYPLYVSGALSGQVLNGFVQDLRITKGYARYTSNFTAPTAAFPTL